jgi:protein TonB
MAFASPSASSLTAGIADVGDLPPERAPTRAAPPAVAIRSVAAAVGSPRPWTGVRKRQPRWVIVLILLAHAVAFYFLLQSGTLHRLVEPRPLTVRLVAAAPAPQPKLPEPPEPQLKPVPRSLSLPLPEIVSATAPAAPAPTPPVPEQTAPAQPAPPAPVVPPNFIAAYLDNPAPVYPPLSRRLHETGQVLLHAHVNVEGHCDKVDIQQSSGFARLDQAALDAVRRWRFVPARQGEQTVAAWVLIPVNFALDG